MKVKQSPTVRNRAQAAVICRCDRALSPFLWNNGQPSIFWSENGERAAQRMEKVKGKAVDARGRPQVDVDKSPWRGPEIQPGQVAKVRKGAAK